MTKKSLKDYTITQSSIHMSQNWHYHTQRGDEKVFRVFKLDCNKNYPKFTKINVMYSTVNISLFLFTLDLTLNFTLKTS